MVSVQKEPMQGRMGTPSIIMEVGRWKLGCMAATQESEIERKHDLNSLVQK